MYINALNIDETFWLNGFLKKIQRNEENICNFESFDLNFIEKSLYEVNYGVTTQNQISIFPGLGAMSIFCRTLGSGGGS